MRDINTRGRKRGDSSSPPETIATIVAANPLSQGETEPDQLACKPP
jgi:hypothetical protein